MKSNRFASLGKSALSALAIAACCGLAACGGDSGSPTPTPASSNSAPRFTSGTTATVAENSTGSVYNATATDADGDPTIFSISGGADAAFFGLSRNSLVFRSAPNFDLYADSNGDNVYSVTLQVSDGKGVATQSVNVNVTNSREGISVKRIATGLGSNSLVTPRFESESLLVARQDGQIIGIDSVTGAQTSYVSLFAPGETGRVLAFDDPKFVSVALLEIDGVGVVLRPRDITGYRTGNSQTLSTNAAVHPLASIIRGPRSRVFAALGDPDGSRAQDAASAFGKVYEIHIDPYCGASLRSVCLSSDIIGDGVHAPGGGALYPDQSILFDRGVDEQEEITFFDPFARPLDFGWPSYEGSHARVANPPAQVNGPNVIYARGNGVKQGSGIVGGTAYTGGLSSLADRLVFADVSGKIFVVPLTFLTDGILHNGDQIENRTADFAPDAGSIDQPRAIIVDQSQRLFILDADGELFRVDAG